MKLNTLTLLERFEEKFVVDAESGCWLWTACCNQRENGYGSFWMNGTQRVAHRVAYELYVGQIPDGLYVCHTCDVKRCVRPDHLWLGTHSDNMADRDRKDRCVRGNSHYARLHPERMPRGEQHSRAKITADDVLAIRAEAGLTQKEVALKYNVCQQQISRIRGGKRWAHI